jgi:hypothetical protein
MLTNRLPQLGFSGFFVKTAAGALPVELLSFTGKNTEGVKTRNGIIISLKEAINTIIAYICP